PYARFQSAMFDKDTMIISYDTARGEPRGPRPRGIDHRAKGLGDCLDCTLCVQVCPTGIDIRKGLQYECIACAACVDACDQVMDKMDYPRGLIRYTTENALEGKPAHVLRPRVFIYALLLVLALGGLATAIALRTPLEMDVLRDRNVLYRTVEMGLVANSYTLKVLNMDQDPHTYRLGVEGPESLELIADRTEFRVEPGEVLSVPVSLRVDPVDLPSPSSDVRFTLQAVDDPELRVVTEARFLGPVGR
ncbi:MAG: 4Fe-4S dicluster domain-containing protein, partial [Candidatus Competibacterales bacterium]|nr:4Fe-4S dicluster domain-containing protein [Candidatus Competibacterales bacterium]